MRTPNEFWIALHELAQAAAAEGTSTSERKQNILQSFREMPRVAQREVVAQLAQMMTFLPDVYVEIVPAMAEPRDEIAFPLMGKMGGGAYFPRSSPQESDGDSATG